MRTIWLHYDADGRYIEEPPPPGVNAQWIELYDPLRDAVFRRWFEPTAQGRAEFGRMIAELRRQHEKYCPPLTGAGQDPGH
jgi:hypothetical protein